MNRQQAVPTQQQRRELDRLLTADRIERSGLHRAATTEQDSDDVPPALTTTQIAIVAVFWCTAMAASCWFCTNAGAHFLNAVWSMK